MFRPNGIDREPGGRTAWWPSCVSSQSSGRRSLGVGLAAQALPSFHPREVADIVASKLILDWSPEQISGWLKIQYPDDESMRCPRNHLPSLFIQAAR